MKQGQDMHKTNCFVLGDGMDLADWWCLPSPHEDDRKLYYVLIPNERLATRSVAQEE